MNSHIKIIIAIITITVFILGLSVSILAKSEKWRVIESEHFTIHYVGSDSQAVLVQRVSEDFYIRVTDILGAISGKIEVWLLPRKQFRATAAAPIRDWAVGYAYPLKRRVVIQNSNFIEESRMELTRIVKHEIVHVIFGARIRQHIKNVPLWFNEGIAMYESDEWSYGQYWLILSNVFKKSIIPLDQLSNQFPEDKYLAQLAYAESFNAVSMIARDHGDKKLREIVDILARGEEMDSAFVLAIGMNLSQFQQRWMQYLTRHYKWFSILSSSTLLWGSVTLILLWAYLRRRRLNRMKLAEWEREENQEDEFFREI